MPAGRVRRARDRRHRRRRRATCSKLKPGTERRASARRSARRSPTRRDRRAISPLTAQGPTAGGLPKPDLAAPGSALTVGRRRAVVGGTARSPPRASPPRPPSSPARTPELTPAAAARRADRRRRARATSRPTAPARARVGAPTARRSPPTRRPPVSGALDPITRRPQRHASRAPVTLRATGGATVAAADAVTLVPGTPATRHRPPAQAGHDHRPARGARRRQRVVASVPWLIRPDDGRAGRGRRR